MFTILRGVGDHGCRRWLTAVSVLFQTGVGGGGGGGSMSLSPAAGAPLLVSRRSVDEATMACGHRRALVRHSSDDTRRRRESFASGPAHSSASSAALGLSSGEEILSVLSPVLSLPGTVKRAGSGSRDHLSLLHVLSYLAISNTGGQMPEVQSARLYCRAEWRECRSSHYQLATSHC